MRLILVHLVSAAFLIISCEKNKTPLSVEDATTTSHDYQWQIDTLSGPDAFQIMMSGIWGTDENNVWVVGHSDETKYQVWHWDGVKWENHFLLFPGHPHSLDAIYGFSANDVWVTGVDFRNYPAVKHRSLIAHYDGNNWELIEEIDAPQCLSVWGSDPSNLFVGCDSGVVLYFNGNKWTKQTTGTSSRIYSIQGFSPNQVYAMGYHLDYKSPIDSLYYYFFEYDGSGWEILQTYIDYPFAPSGLFGYKLWASPDGDLYSVGDDGLYLWKNRSWSHLREKKLLAINGTGWNNIFIAGPSNHIHHFNGDSWFRYDFFNDYSFDAGFAFWCNTNFVFMAAQLGNQSFVIRGELKERR